MAIKITNVSQLPSAALEQRKAWWEKRAKAFLLMHYKNPTPQAIRHLAILLDVAWIDGWLGRDAKKRD